MPARPISRSTLRKSVLVAVGVLAASTVVVAGLDAFVGLPGGVLDGRYGPSVGSPAPTTSTASGRPPTPTSSPSPSATASPSDDVSPGAVPDPEIVARRLDPRLSVPSLGPAVSGSVVDLVTGQVLYARAPARPRIPASTTKLLTAAAALQRVGGDTRIATTVVRSGRTLVLVGGGDPSLRVVPGGRDPSLRSLARRTAAALRGTGVDDVRLRYDASLFAPPRQAPAWPRAYVRTGVVGPVTALSVGAGRGADPPAEAAEAFADELERVDVDVVGRVRPAGGSVAIDATGAPLAQVESRPVARLVERMLRTSDNDYAEALGHLAGIAAGEPATFAGAAAATQEVLVELGVPTLGVRLADASGLARTNRVPAPTLTTLLVRAAAPDRPELTPILVGLPVAGFSGTLADRFQDPPESSGAGVVRAKTGTLTGVSALSGVVTDRTGRVLGFSFLADRVRDAAGAQTALDRAAATLARCGCR